MPAPFNQFDEPNVIEMSSSKVFLTTIRKTKQSFMLLNLREGKKRTKEHLHLEYCIRGGGLSAGET